MGLSYAGPLVGWLFVFFFQAEDGIRDYKVTGVQTCALPISAAGRCGRTGCRCRRRACWPRDRKSTRLNSSHLVISYAVFCLKKKKKIIHFSEYSKFNLCLRAFVCVSSYITCYVTICECTIAH